MSKIVFTEQAFSDYLYWQGQDKKTLKRINTPGLESQSP